MREDYDHTGRQHIVIIEYTLATYTDNSNDPLIRCAFNTSP